MTDFLMAMALGLFSVLTLVAGVDRAHRKAYGSMAEAKATAVNQATTTALKVIVIVLLLVHVGINLYCARQRHRQMEQLLETYRRAQTLEQRICTEFPETEDCHE